MYIISRTWDRRILFFFLQMLGIRSWSGDLEHFVSRSASSALFAKMADHDFNVTDVVNLGAANLKVSQNLLHWNKNKIVCITFWVYFFEMD